MQYIAKHINAARQWGKARQLHNVPNVGGGVIRGSSRIDNNRPYLELRPCPGELNDCQLCGAVFGEAGAFNGGSQPFEHDIPFGGVDTSRAVDDDAQLYLDIIIRGSGCSR